MKLRHVLLITKLDRRRERSRQWAKHGATFCFFLIFLRAFSRKPWRKRWKDPIGESIKRITAEMPEVYFNRVPDPLRGVERVQVNVHRETRLEYVPEKPSPVYGSMRRSAVGSARAMSVRIEGKRWAYDLDFSKYTIALGELDPIFHPLRLAAESVMRMIDQDEQRQREAAY